MKGLHMSDVATYWIVKGTLGLLIFFSALTWTVVLAKAFQQWRIARQNDGFAKAFPATNRLPAPDVLRAQMGPTARVASAGLDAWQSSEPIGVTGEAIDVRRDVLERSLRQQIQRERRSIEAGLAVLASVGSTSPFVGLFGTVLGIIHALSRISSLGSASLDVVAGPIGEALVATGIGIAVAVPAVLAYNVFVRRLKSIAADLEDYANSFVNTAIRSSYGEGRHASNSIEVPVSRSLTVAREASA
jgi:biopolymer transport protein ExbB